MYCTVHVMSIRYCRLKALAEGSNAMRVSWCAPSELDLNGTPLAGYRLELVPIRRGGSSRALSASGETTSYVAVSEASATSQLVSDLRANTAYRVRLALLYCVHQQSQQTEFSEGVQCATLTEAPRCAPQPIALVSSLPTSLMLEWPAIDVDVDGDVDVGFAATDGGNGDEETGGGAAQEARAEADAQEASAGADFRFGDLARDEMAALSAGGRTRGLAIGRQEQHEPEHVPKHVAEPVSKPRPLHYELEVAELSSSSSANANGPTAAFLDELQAALESTTAHESRSNNDASHTPAFYRAYAGAEHSCRLTKLSEARQYACRVRAVAAAGPSPWSALHVFSTSVALPSQLKGALFSESDCKRN